MLVRYCPECKVDLRAKDIVETLIDKEGYTKEEASKTAVDYWGYDISKDNQQQNYFWRTIGRYDRELDRTTHWQCPDCGYRWKWGV